MSFVQLNKAIPEEDIGQELAVFDRAGMIAASYRRVQLVYHVWEYNRDDAGIEHWRILDSEERARALCLMLADRRGPHRSEDLPDLDEMFRREQLSD